MARNYDPADSGYNEVASRIVEFRNRYPDGALQPVDPSHPYKVETIGNATFIVYTAAAYRGPDDTRPGIATAWEPFPGTTPYTRNSELMNAETSAWGRAIIAVLASDSKKGISTAEEIRNRQAEREQQPATNPGRQPRDGQGWPAASGPALVNKAMLAKLANQFTTLGVADRDEGLMTIALLTGVQVKSTKDLTAEQAQQLIGVLDPLTQEPDPSAALTKALEVAMAATHQEQGVLDGQVITPEETHHAAA
jgi:hypothetical protein